MSACISAGDKCGCAILGNDSCEQRASEEGGGGRREGRGKGCRFACVRVRAGVLRAELGGKEEDETVGDTRRL